MAAAVISQAAPLSLNLASYGPSDSLNTSPSRQWQHFKSYYMPLNDHFTQYIMTRSRMQQLFKLHASSTGQGSLSVARQWQPQAGRARGWQGQGPAWGLRVMVLLWAAAAVIAAWSHSKSVCAVNWTNQ